MIEAAQSGFGLAQEAMVVMVGVTGRHGCGRQRDAVMRALNADMCVR
jgi:hypothetical protein